MQFDERPKSQAIILSTREIAALIAFSCKDDKVPTLHGASLLLEGKTLEAYASDGNRSLRGTCKLRESFDRYEYLVPREVLVLAQRVLTDGQEARFPLGAKCVIGGFEIWSITTDAEADQRLDSIELANPIVPNRQLGLPFAAIDSDLDPSTRSDIKVEAKFSAGCFLALKKVAHAGLTPNLALSVAPNGCLYGTTDGGTEWRAMVKPVSLEVTQSEEDADEPTDDPSVTDSGELALTPTEPKKRGRRVGKSRDMTPELKERWARERKEKRGKRSKK